MTNVLVVGPFKEEQRKRIEEAGKGCSFRFCADFAGAGVSPGEIASADVIIGNLIPMLIKESPRLKLMQLTSAGADAYVKPGVLAKGTVLCNSTGAYNKTVSQHALAVTLAMQKKLYLYRDNQNENLWRDEGEVGSIADSTVLVMGLREIGIAYAKMCKALGAYVIGVKRRPSACPEGIDEVYTMDRLDEVLPKADIVFSILPGTSATYHIYTAERFRLMKKSAIFINCGRGDAVENEVLFDALKNGEIAAASIDVAEGEPLPADSPLWGLKNLFITPHVAGFFHIPDTLEIITDIACHNLNAYLTGGSYRNIVDFSTGYKA